MAFSRFRVKKGILVATDSNPEGVPLIPTGFIAMFSGQLAPEGFLICDGSEVGRYQYPDLFQYMKERSFPYGGGNGSTTFHVPDFRGRIPRGGVTGQRIGEFGGAETHTLVSSNMPPHAHDIPTHTHGVTAGNVGSMNANNANHAHNYSANTNDPGGHAHGVGLHGGAHNWYSATDIASGNTNRAQSTSPATHWPGIGDIPFGGSTNTGSANHSHSFSQNSGNQSANHTHGFTVGATSGNTDTGNTAGGALAMSPIDHMNPFLAINFIIKY
jgi:microcystin-dependent protein